MRNTLAPHNPKLPTYPTDMRVRETTPNLAHRITQEDLEGLLRKIYGRPEPWWRRAMRWFR